MVLAGCVTGDQYRVNRAAWTAATTERPAGTRLRDAALVPALHAATGEAVHLRPETLPASGPVGSEAVVLARAEGTNARALAGWITAVPALGWLTAGSFAMSSYVDSCTGGRGYDNCGGGLFAGGWMLASGVASAVAATVLLATMGRDHPERASGAELRRRGVWRP